MLKLRDMTCQKIFIVISWMYQLIVMKEFQGSNMAMAPYCVDWSYELIFLTG